MSVQLNILCQNFINLQYPQNCIEFDNDTWFSLNFYSKTVKQIRSLTHTVSSGKIQHVRSKWVSAERMLKGRKHFSQSVRPMVSVTVSKLGKTDLAFVQPDAKINSVYYCENLLEEQGLLLAIRRISNHDFVFKQDGAPCTPFTTVSLACIPTCLSSLNQKTGCRTVQI